MSEATPQGDGRISYGVDVNRALQAWGGYADFPEGFDQVRKVLEVLASVLGHVSACYTLPSDRYVAIQLSASPQGNAAYANIGFIWITPAALNEAEARGQDLRQLLTIAGLMVHDGVEDGLTIWNSRGLRDRTKSLGSMRRDGRLCPNCFVRWPGEACPDCEVDLMPP